MQQADDCLNVTKGVLPVMEDDFLVDGSLVSWLAIKSTWQLVVLLLSPCQGIKAVHQG